MSLTIIAGATLSGSSMLAKLCAENGAWIGDVEYEIPNDVQNYESYDNIRLAQLCRNALGIENRPEMVVAKDKIDIAFKEFFDGLPTETEIVVLKYQKAAHFIPFFRDQLGVKFKLVYALRNPYTRAVSYYSKFHVSPFTIALYEWEQAYIHMTQGTKDIPLYTVLYERFLTEPECEARQLFKFIGMSTRKIDLSSIDQTLRHF